MVVPFAQGQSKPSPVPSNFASKDKDTDVDACRDQLLGIAQRGFQCEAAPPLLRSSCGAEEPENYDADNSASGLLAEREGGGGLCVCAFDFLLSLSLSPFLCPRFLLFVLRDRRAEACCRATCPKSRRRRTNTCRARESERERLWRSVCCAASLARTGAGSSLKTPKKRIQPCPALGLRPNPCKDRVEGKMGIALPLLTTRHPRHQDIVLTPLSTPPPPPQVNRISRCPRLHAFSR